jgi:phosphatidylserine/phosphatidylglycerophosphate/cardiolipin synthase-like enzyme
VELKLIRDRAHYEDVVMGSIAGARVSVWISTANVKELRVEAPLGSRARAAGRFMSILEMFDGLAGRGIDLRMLHAGVPSRAFRAELRGHPRLVAGGLAMRRCPRVHLKMIAVDGAVLYLGSANFTGAGLGAKGDKRRNFEAGVLTDDDVLLDEMQGAFDAIWSGRECKGCALRAVCPAPIDTLVEGSRRGDSLLQRRPRSNKSGP